MASQQHRCRICWNQTRPLGRQSGANSKILLMRLGGRRRLPEGFSRRPFLPPLTVEGLRVAARSFRSRLGLGCDNVHPRLFDWLSTELLQGFVSFIIALERVGIWPRQVAAILVAQVPKAGGGRRPIGLLSGLVKLWERAKNLWWKLGDARPSDPTIGLRRGEILSGSCLEAGPFVRGRCGTGAQVGSYAA